MTLKHERIVRGRISTEHLVQLFDDSESLAETVAAFLFEGVQRDETLVVVARPEHWASMARRLSIMGCAVDEVIASGRLVVLDAATTMASFLRNGYPVPDRFEASVARLVERLSEQFGKRLRIYGEMVDILASQSEFGAALELERFWNDLGLRYSFTLLCGYSAGHFGDARTATALREICSAHDHATSKSQDLLATWLLSDRQSSYHTDPR